MIVDMGQSGRPGTPTYAHAVDSWTRGELWPLSMDEATYADGALGALTLVPAP
jgi:acyl-homoserine lactone acylase PvdQ